MEVDPPVRLVSKHVLQSHSHSVPRAADEDVSVRVVPPARQSSAAVYETTASSSRGSAHDFVSEFINESLSMGDSRPVRPAGLSRDEVLSLCFSDHRENTAFLTCDGVQQLIPPDSKPLDPTRDLYVSIFVPQSSLLGGPKVITAQDMDDNTTMSSPMIEIMCQVMDVHRTPFDQEQLSAITAQ